MDGHPGRVHRDLLVVDPEPGTVRVESAGPRRLSVTFANAAFEGGTFEFRNEQQAAEVSLWLLGSFRPMTAVAGDLAQKQPI